MRILLAGGTGVLGRAALPRLVAAGHEVTVVSRRAETDPAVHAARAQPLRLDLFDADAVAAAVDDCDAVVNLATHIPGGAAAARRGAWRLNDRLRTGASRNLAEAATTRGARFVQESFAPTYPDCGDRWITEETPLDPAAQTTTVIDAEASADLVTSTGGTGVVLRFGLFYGAGSPQTRDLLRAARNGRLLLPGPARRYTSMVYVEDAAAAVVAALDLPAGRYNVVEDEPMTRRDHAEILARLLGRDRLRLLPAAVGWYPLLRVIARSHRISNARLRAESGWQPAAPTVRDGWRMILAEVADER